MAMAGSSRGSLWSGAFLRRARLPLTSNKRAFFILIFLFALCSLIYYFGELVDTIGWTALRWPIFYTVHDLHRMLFLAPIVYAAYHFRVKGAVIVTVAAFLTFLPRSLFISPYPYPMLRMLLFVLPAGAVGTFVAIVCNWREQKARLEIIARSERDRLLSILEGVGDGVCIIGPDYRVRFINPAMTAEFGDGMSCCCHKYLYGLDEPCEQNCHLPVVVAGTGKRWEYTFPDGRTFEIIASPFRDSDGKVCQLTTFRNVTQRKRVELELLGLSQFKSDVLSSLSHELRSPLTSMKGIVSSLLQKDVRFDNETHDMLLGGVLKETNRLETLVTNLLDMSKLEAGVWKPAKKRCSVPDIVNEAVERFRWSHQEHVFGTELDPELPDVDADYGQIRQVLFNLLDNAVAYSEEGTKITVRARQMDDQVELSVSDQGSGISEEDAAKIFDKFYRGAQKRKHGGGVGLGLAICQAIVQAHGGRIWADGKSGQGSTFYFTLPVQSSG